MTKKFSVLLNKMPLDARLEVEERARKTLAEMPLNDIRRARDLSQEMLGEVLNIQGPALEKLEQQTDMYITSLRSHIEAMGGDLEIVAHFPQGKVEITQFSQLNA